MTTDKAIQVVSGISPTECSCNKCVNMCKTAPCLGTPEDMAKLIAAGYGDKIMPTTVATPIVLAHFGKPINIFALEFDDENGQCCMLENGLCKLHESGLKPLEGKLANCNYILKNIEFSPNILIVELWNKLNLL